MAWQTPTLRLLIGYLFLFIILLLNADHVWPTKPASGLGGLSGTGLGTEKGELAQKKRKCMSVGVWVGAMSLPQDWIPRGGS